MVHSQYKLGMAAILPPFPERIHFFNVTEFFRKLKKIIVLTPLTHKRSRIHPSLDTQYKAKLLHSSDMVLPIILSRNTCTSFIEKAYSLGASYNRTRCKLNLKELRFIYIKRSDFLPPANKVWGKVMFLHLSVSQSVYRGDCTWRGGTCVTKGVCVAGCAWQRRVCGWQGACVAGG